MDKSLSLDRFCWSELHSRYVSYSVSSVS